MYETIKEHIVCFVALCLFIFLSIFVLLRNRKREDIHSDGDRVDDIREQLKLATKREQEIERTVERAERRVDNIKDNLSESERRIEESKSIIDRIRTREQKESPKD